MDSTQGIVIDKEIVEVEQKERLTFFQGAQAGLPIALGYLPIAIAFGLMANSAGVPNIISVLMSFSIFAGASQFVGVNLLALQATYGEIILTTFILNLRHFLMTASISQRIEKNTSKKWLALLAFGITDETFSVASLRNEPVLTPQFVLGLNLISFSAWNLGTWIGVFLGAGLPQSIQQSMGIALYAMFIGLLIPSMGKTRSILTVALASAGFHSLLHWVPLFASISTGWRIVIATMLAALLGTILFSKEGEL